MNIILNIEDFDKFSSPIIRLTKSRTGLTGTAIFTFIFKNSEIINLLYDKKIMIYKLSLNFEKNSLISHTVKISFKQGKPFAIVFIFVLKNLTEWKIFNLFIKHYAKKKNLVFQNYEH